MEATIFFNIHNQQTAKIFPRMKVIASRYFKQAPPIHTHTHTRRIIFLFAEEAVLAFRIFREALMTTTWCYHRR